MTRRNGENISPLLTKFVKANRVVVIRPCSVHHDIDIIVRKTLHSSSTPAPYGAAEMLALPPLDVIEIVPTGGAVEPGGGAVTVTLADWPGASVPPAALRW